MQKPNILLVGCGKMGGALLNRWEELNLAQDIRVIEPSNPAYLPTPAALPQGYAPSVIIYAVKPQSLPGIIGDYRAFDALHLSIAAGKPLSFFEGHLGNPARVVRAMPNTPAAIGRGMTVACANKNVTAAERETAGALLSAVGDMLWVEDEKLLDPVTALSGSGPAYVFLLTEMLAAAGAKAGLDPAMAQTLARQTVIGSAALMDSSAETPAQLRENVTSPGGTTAAALHVLMNGKTQEIFDAAIRAATKRAEELAG